MGTEGIQRLREWSVLGKKLDAVLKDCEGINLDWIQELDLVRKSGFTENVMFEYISGRVEFWIASLKMGREGFPTLC